jgi:hypothetical protein
MDEYDDEHLSSELVRGLRVISFVIGAVLLLATVVGVLSEDWNYPLDLLRVVATFLAPAGWLGFYDKNLEKFADTYREVGVYPYRGIIKHATFTGLGVLIMGAGGIVGVQLIILNIDEFNKVLGIVLTTMALSCGVIGFTTYLQRHWLDTMAYLGL